MDMNFLYAILIALAPVVITILVSRAYNIFHGLITFLVLGYALLFCLDLFAEKLPAELALYLGMGEIGCPLPYGTVAIYSMINVAVVDLLTKAGLENLISNKNFKYYLLGGYVLLFVISQVIASAIRRRRVAKINRLRRYLRRY